MKDKYLFSFDLDGTLLYDWEYISEDTIKYIKQLKDEGHICIIATGRPYRSSIKYYELLELNTPLINYNGALVQHPKNDDYIKKSITIKKETLLNLLTDINEWTENAFCEVEDDIFLMKEQDDIMHLLHLDGGILHIGDLHETLNDNPNGCILIAKANKEMDIENFINSKYKGLINCRNWGHEYSNVIELFTPHSSKGKALKSVIEEYNIPIENTYAFGDAHNDIEMLQVVGNGIAMINSQNSLLEIAEFVTDKDNKNDGVIHYIDKYIKK